MLYFSAPTFIFVILTFATGLHILHFAARLTLSLVTYQTVHTIPTLLSGATTLTLKQISGCMRSVELSEFIGPCRLNTTNCHYFLPSVCFLRDAVWKNRNRKVPYNEFDVFCISCLWNHEICHTASITAFFKLLKQNTIVQKFQKIASSWVFPLSACPHSYLELNKVERENLSILLGSANQFFNMNFGSGWENTAFVQWTAA